MADGSGFNLQQILDLRREMERQRHREFTAAREALQAAEDRLSREKERSDRILRELFQRQGGGIEASEFSLYATFSQNQRQVVTEQMETVRQLGQELDARRRQLLEASREKKVLEKLRERRLDDLKRELARKERKLLDELSLRQRGDDR